MIKVQAPIKPWLAADSYLLPDDFTMLRTFESSSQSYSNNKIMMTTT